MNKLKLKYKFMVKHLKILTLLILVILLGGCSYQGTKTNLELQDNCSIKAKDFYTGYIEDNGYDQNNTNYVNHYNKKLNKCFIIVTNEGDLGFHKVLYDVYENKEWGGIHAEGTVIGLCGVQDKTCKSREEFNNLVMQYMEK
jgi:hypothetical protein